MSVSCCSCGAGQVFGGGSSCGSLQVFAGQVFGGKICSLAAT